MCILEPTLLSGLALCYLCKGEADVMMCLIFSRRISCMLSGLDGIKIASSYEDRYLVQNSDIHTYNYSLPPHLSPLRSFLTKVKTDSN